MDIFKLGDKILALLEIAFGFWNNQVSLVFSMLGQSPVNFKGGGPWQVVESIEQIFVGVGSSLAANAQHTFVININVMIAFQFISDSSITFVW